MSYTTLNRLLVPTWEGREKLILESEKPLIIKNYTLTENDDCLEDFVHNFFMEYNRKNGTTVLGQPEGQQCNANRLRSLIDLFMICKSYFPSCTLEEVKNELYKVQGLSSQVCSTVRRRVYWKQAGSIVNNHAHTDQRDEFNLVIREY